MDPVQLRVELFNKTTSKDNFFAKIAIQSPLAYPAGGLLFGITLQQYFQVNPISISLIALCLILSLLYFLCRHIAVNETKCLTMAFLGFMVLGMGRVNLYYYQQPNSLNLCDITEPTIADIKGSVASETVITQVKSNYQSNIEYRGKFLLNAEEVLTSQGWKKCSGKIVVFVEDSGNNQQEFPLIGEKILIYSVLSKPLEPHNKADFDYKKYLGYQNIELIAHLKGRDSIEKIGNGKTSNLTGIRRWLGKFASKSIINGTEPENESEALLTGLLLGQRENISKDTFEAFRKTGLAHLLSLSGMHVGILLAGIWFVSKKIGLGKRGASILSIIFIVAFLMTVPSRTPVSRAGFICIFYCMSILITKRVNGLNSLAICSICLLLYKPTDLFSISFQLSFVAVTAILLLTRDIYLWLHEKSGFRFSGRFSNSALQLLAVGLAAWIGTAPLVAYHFQQINPLGPIWTIITIPLVGVSLISGLLAIFCQYIPLISNLLSFISKESCHILNLSVQYLAEIKTSQIITGHISTVTIVVIYLLILFMLTSKLLSRISKERIATISLLAFITVGSFDSLPFISNESLKLEIFSVGHGQSILIQTPEHNYLLDAGSTSINNMGEKTIIPNLRYLGINKLDGIFISHADSDHYNGIKDIIENIKTNNITMPIVLSDKIVPDNYGTSIIAFDNNFIENDITIQKLWPIDNIEIPSKSDNNNSLVLLISYANRTILLCSDIEIEAQNSIMNQYSNLKADIVVLPHHGSGRTLKAGFIEMLEPETTISSCSHADLKRNGNLKFGNTKAYSTAIDGQISIEISCNGEIKTSSFIKE